MLIHQKNWHAPHGKQHTRHPELVNKAKKLFVSAHSKLYKFTSVKFNHYEVKLFILNKT
jgi:hypothetical protein